MALPLKALGLASLAALATQPFMLVLSVAMTSGVNGTALLPAEMLDAAAFGLLVVAGFLVVFGWPVFFLLRRLQCLSARTASLAGFVIAGAPMALLCYVGRAFSGSFSSGHWHGQPVRFIADNRVTLHGWLMYGELCVLAGLHGIAAALAFYYVWQRLQAPHAAKVAVQA